MNIFEFRPLKDKNGNYKKKWHGYACEVVIIVKDDDEANNLIRSGYYDDKDVCLGTDDEDMMYKIAKNSYYIKTGGELKRIVNVEKMNNETLEKL